MATIISDKNLENFKEDNQLILNTIAGWDTPCDAITNCLSSGDVGPVFKENFGVGRKSHEKITELIKILHEMESSIRELINNTNTFLDEHSNANTKTY